MTKADRALRLYARGYTQAVVSRTLGVSRQYVHKIVRGYRPPHGNCYMSEHLLKCVLASLKKRGPRLTYAEIAADLGWPTWRVRNAVKVLRRQGRFAGRCKLRGARAASH